MRGDFAGEIALAINIAIGVVGDFAIVATVIGFAAQPPFGIVLKARVPAEFIGLDTLETCIEVFGGPRRVIWITDFDDAIKAVVADHLSFVQFVGSRTHARAAVDGLTADGAARINNTGRQT